MFTNQTAYDTAAHHLATLTHRVTRTVRLNGTWEPDPDRPGLARPKITTEGAYFGDTGGRCVIGALLPAQVRRWKRDEIEGISAAGIARRFVNLRNLNHDLLEGLQRLHDHPGAWDDDGFMWWAWASLVELGRKLGLDVTVAETYERKAAERE